MNNDVDTLTKLVNEQAIIVDSVPAWIFYKSKNNTFVRVNKAFCEAMGKSNDELEGKSLFDLYPKEQAEKYWKDDKEVMETGVIKNNIIESAETPNGQKWIQVSKIPYRDKEGVVIGIIGFAIDITEKKLAEDMKNTSQQILQKIIDLLPIRIFWKDKNLIYLGCNRVFAEDSGNIFAKDLVGKDDYQMGWKDQADLYRKDDFEVIKTGISKINYEEKQTTPNGSTIWLNTNKVPLRDDDGNIIGVLGTYIDITSKKLADDKLRSALDETKRMNDLMVGRELKMMELKAKIEIMEKNVKSNPIS